LLVAHAQLQRECFCLLPHLRAGTCCRSNGPQRPPRSCHPFLPLHTCFPAADPCPAQHQWRGQRAEGRCQRSGAWSATGDLLRSSLTEGAPRPCCYCCCWHFCVGQAPAMVRPLRWQESRWVDGAAAGWLCVACRVGLGQRGQQSDAAGEHSRCEVASCSLRICQLSVALMPCFDPETALIL
jgi:hypothetical protein